MMNLDKIGIWSEIKLDIIKEYANAYTIILNKQSWCKGFVYIDAFAGAGQHISKNTGDIIDGSPYNALKVNLSFTEYYFIDKLEERADIFQKMAKDNPKIHAYHGDCNEILIEKIFPSLSYDSYKRALCIIDPYGLDITWKSIKKAAELKTIDIFINFSIMDINRNVLSENLKDATQKNIERMNAFWGDESWKKLMYKEQGTLFGETHSIKSEKYPLLATEYRLKLQKAGYKYVPEPILMRNTNNGPLYYLFFASQNKAADDIVRDIFNKYRKYL
jgi:three-Cys-motif partner protein